jgi:hypothetical protein
MKPSFLELSSYNSGGLRTANEVPPKDIIRAARCAKCGKEIPAGQEVKKGFFIRKKYHKECAS